MLGNWNGRFAIDKIERLVSVMDCLRRHRHPVTAATLAEEQGVSVRTLCHDVQTLMGLGASISGKAGAQLKLVLQFLKGEGAMWRS